MIQEKAFEFFWSEASTVNGLIRDRSQSWSASSIASVGFGLTSICIAADNGWITRAAARDRVATTLRTFWYGPQGSATTGMFGQFGFFYHFLKMDGSGRDWTSELSTIDTALLMAGILDAGAYFDQADPVEAEIRSLADSLYRRANWNLMRNWAPGLQMQWTPEQGFANAFWSGYNEAMIMNILALGSPTHATPSLVWDSWTAPYDMLWQTIYGLTYVTFPPLFGHQYSHCWIDFRSINDAKMKSYGITYFENSRRATLANRLYCMSNPNGYAAYSDSVWGLTACDGPPGRGYLARGAPPGQNDDGTIAPTAAGGSIPFAPTECIAALRTMYRQYCAGTETRLWGPYGFRDAFNIQSNWFDTDYIGIDQGPIVIMIENFFTQSVWNRFMKIPYIQAGLTAAGFTPINTSVGQDPLIPTDVRLDQNYPNPFNPTTTIRFTLPERMPVRLMVTDVIGREVARLVDDTIGAGPHSLSFDGTGLSSGVYFCRLEAPRGILVRSMLLVR